MDYKSMIAGYKEDKGYSAGDEWVMREISRTHGHLLMCFKPSTGANTDTLDEVYALQRFADIQCEHAPWLLDVSTDAVKPGTHDEEIVGGYVVFLLMTKLPGTRIIYNHYWQLSLAERDEIRREFKKALLAVWDCGIYPQDSAPRNVIWDSQNRKCFIVDFEAIEHEGNSKRPEWTDKQFEYWKLAENRFLGFI
ncbi:hypothetical protein BDV95DRAFT_118167 [Massariosphaeria phaeospora]|uniref:Protein kinase domain-containing protein n=1 Tax=Massariosphaeria phaeospora TaxID=100035 RepID=A0A7C8I5G1_9PLEO|nr:hypothetical protein BDV95DRAFT_118167 [Massariosphaeria phaeospora]